MEIRRLKHFSIDNKLKEKQRKETKISGTQVLNLEEAKWELEK